MGPDQIHNILDYVIDTFVLHFKPLGDWPFRRPTWPNRRFSSAIPPFNSEPLLRELPLRSAFYAPTAIKRASRKNSIPASSCTLKLHKLGSHEFRERQSEAEVNLKKLGGVDGCDQEVAPTLDWRLLEPSSAHGALYRRKHGPGLYPIGSCYLITPRSDVSMNRINMSTSSPRSGSDFNFSRVCVVLRLEVRRILYAC